MSPLINSSREARVRSGYAELTRFLIREKLSITAMESCTAGQIASLITDTEGSSAVLKGSFVTYSNEAKIREGVPEDVIRRYGVYSVETAEEMAKACRAAYGADIGIGVTGSFGNPDPANGDSVPGQVYFAVDIRGKVTRASRTLAPEPDRLSYKMAMAEEILKLLREELGF